MKFIAALDLGGGLGEPCALASMRTGGREEKKKLFVAAYILYWLCPQRRLGKLQGLYTEESDLFFFSPQVHGKKKIETEFLFMQMRKFALFLLPTYNIQQSALL